MELEPPRNPKSTTPSLVKMPPGFGVIYDGCSLEIKKPSSGQDVKYAYQNMMDDSKVQVFQF